MHINYHEIIAAVGEGSAHPGGYQGTLDFVESVGIDSGLRILEVGCGTGRTACLLAQKGARVTAMDQSGAMLEKAEKRARLQQLRIDWIQGDICAIPLASESYDVVIAESVTIFAADPVKAYREYCRVLRQGGQVWDRELYQTSSHPELELEMRRLYGNARLPDQEQWMNMMRDAGFQRVRQWEPAAETGEAGEDVGPDGATDPENPGRTGASAASRSFNDAGNFAEAAVSSAAPGDTDADGAGVSIGGDGAGDGDSAGGGGDGAAGDTGDTAGADDTAGAAASSFAWEIALDPYRFIDPEALLNPAVAAFFWENEAFLQQYRKHLSYGVFIGEK